MQPATSAGHTPAGFAAPGDVHTQHTVPVCAPLPSGEMYKDALASRSTCPVLHKVSYDFHNHPASCPVRRRTLPVLITSSCLVVTSCSSISGWSWTRMFPNSDFIISWSPIALIRSNWAFWLYYGTRACSCSQKAMHYQQCFPKTSDELHPDWGWIWKGK